MICADSVEFAELLIRVHTYVVMSVSILSIDCSILTRNVYRVFSCDVKCCARDDTNLLVYSCRVRVGGRSSCIKLLLDVFGYSLL